MSAAKLSGKLLLLSSLSVSVCAQSAPYFDGRKAFDLLEAQVAMGPRYNGSPGHQALQETLATYLGERAHDLRLHEASMEHPYNGGTLEIINFLARFNTHVTQRIMILAHYDTRPFADQDPIEANRNTPILGANDGASGVAILMVLADMMAADPPDIGVDLLFVDAEDVGRSGDLANFALGTRMFVKDMNRVLGGIRPRYAVLLDMVGDKELSLPIEAHSWRGAPQLVRRVWDIAAELGYSQFKFENGPAIFDDHVPLLEAGIPAIDIIDFDYPNRSANYWHTLEDTADKCSPESLEAVGTVVAALIYGERP